VQRVDANVEQQQPQEQQPENADCFLQDMACQNNEFEAQRYFKANT